MSGEPAGAEPIGRVLVMDDDPIILRSTSRMLRLLGYDVDTAPDGETAVARYREALAAGRRFDVAILDLSVGVTHAGGVEALEHLAAADPLVCAVVSSGDLDDTRLAQYLARGFKGRLKKHYDRASLKDLLAALVPHR